MACYRWWRRSVALAATLVLTACVGSPIRIAQTVEQKAYATYGSYVIVQEQAVKLTTPSSTLPAATKVKIVEAFKKAQPAVDTMLKGLNSYEQARGDFETQKIQKPAFQIVVDNLANWVTQAQVLIADLSAAVRGAKP